MRAKAAAYEKIIEHTLFNGDTLQEFKLKNGLRVLLVPRHQAKVLTYQTWFNVGSVNEKLDPKLNKTGIAHLFEHMMFRGSQKYPDGQFDEITARMGVEQQNASTFYYRTNYYESIPSHHLKALMEIEADRMRALKLTSDLFEKEKGAVVGEFRRHLDSAASVASDELMRLVFSEAPYRYTVLGTEAEIKGFTLDEAKYFYQTFYAPNNATLIVIGDTDEKTLLPLVVQFYGDALPQVIPRPEIPAEPEQKKERRFEMTHPQATSETLLVAYRIGGIASPDAVPLSLLSAHLSRGMEARLHKLLVDKGIAVGTHAGASSQPDLFEFFIQLAEGHSAEEALRVVDKEILSLQTQKLKAPELQRALNQERLNLYGDISDNSELGTWLGEFLMLSGNYMRGFEIVAAIPSVTATDIQRVAKQYFKKTARSVVIVRPKGTT